MLLEVTLISPRPGIAKPDMSPPQGRVPLTQEQPSVLSHVAVPQQALGLSESD